MSNQEQETAALGPESQAIAFVDYVYENFDSFKLLIGCSKGSFYENYLDELVDILVDSTMRFMKETGMSQSFRGKSGT